MALLAHRIAWQCSKEEEATASFGAGANGVAANEIARAGESGRAIRGRISLITARCPDH
jgi:hypothetical protein